MVFIRALTLRSRVLRVFWFFWLPCYSHNAKTRLDLSLVSGSGLFQGYYKEVFDIVPVHYNVALYAERAET